MSKIEKDAFATILQSRGYYANGAQNITGIFGRDSFLNLRDSTVWYDERLKAIVFPHELEYQGGTTIPASNPDKYYIQNWVTTPGGITNGAYLSIVHYVGGTWNMASDFDVDEDFVVYVKGESDDSLGVNKLYSYKDDDGTKWTDLGEAKIVPHNYSLYKQGGNEAANEFYHMTEDEYDSLPNIGNSLIYFDQRVALGAFDIAIGPITTPVLNGLYLITDATGIEFDLKQWNGSSYIVTATSKNVYLYCSGDEKNYIYNPVLDKYLIAETFKHAAHNNLKKLQGGAAGEYYHLTQAEYSALTASGDFEYYEYVIQEVTDVQAHLIGSYSDGDFVILNNESSTLGVKVYRMVTGAWHPQPALTDRVYIINNLDQNVWVYNKATNLFESKGKHILAFHNNTQGLQGGNLTERYHLNQSAYNSLVGDFLEYSVNVYVDPLSGLNTNDGTSGHPVQTSDRVAEILKYRKIIKVSIYNDNLTGTSGNFVISEDLERVFDENEYLDELVLRGVLGTSEPKTYIAGTPNTLLDSQTPFSQTGYYSYKGVNIFKPNSGILDDTIASDRIIAIPTNFTITGAPDDNNYIVSKFTFNTVNNSSVNYKIKVITATLDSNKSYFSQLSLISNSVFITTSTLFVDTLIIDNAIIDGGIIDVNVGLFAKLTLNNSQLNIHERLTSENGGLVINLSKINISKGAKFIYKASGDTPLTIFNAVTDIFILGENSTLEMNHSSVTKVTFLYNAATLDFINYVERGASAYVNSGTVLYKSAALTTIESGIDNSDFYENESNEIKILLEDNKYLEAKQMFYLDSITVPASTGSASSITTIAKHSDVKGFIANVYIEEISTGKIYIKTWQVFYNGTATLVTTVTGPT